VYILCRVALKFWAQRMNERTRVRSLAKIQEFQLLAFETLDIIRSR
jgi:hypothetical protein